jgi:hypothetical protein
LWRNRQTEVRLVLRPKPRNRRGDFEAQITKPELPVLRPKPKNSPPPWFWGSTKKLTAGFEAIPGETVITSFEAKLEKTVATDLEAKPEKTVAAGFEAKPPETITAGFEDKLPEIITTGFEIKPPETVTTGFEVKQTKIVWAVLSQTTHKPSTLVLRLNQETRASHLHVHGADRTRCHLTSRSPGHWVPDLCNHPRSSAPDLLLLPRSSSLHAMPHLPPAHHETSKHDSLNETKIQEKQNETVSNSNSNLAKSMTYHNQTKKLTTWFLDLSLDESIDNKITKFEVWIQNPMKHS